MLFPPLQYVIYIAVSVPVALCPLNSCIVFLCWYSSFCLVNPLLLDIIFLFSVSNGDTSCTHTVIYSCLIFFFRVKMCNTIFEFFPCHVCVDAQAQRFFLHYEADFSYFVFHPYFSLWGRVGGSVLGFKTFLFDSWSEPQGKLWASLSAWSLGNSNFQIYFGD